MRTEDMILVSVDDHVIEPRGMFDGLLPAKYQDGAPAGPPGGRHRRLALRRQRHPQRRPERRRRAPARGVRHRAHLARGHAGRLLRRARAGARHVGQRRARLHVLPVLPPVLRPALRPARGQGRGARDGARLQRLAHRQVVRRRPGRFIPLSIPVIWDPELGAEEVRRVAKKGCHAVTFSENPEKLGWPSLHNSHWDPFWSACADEGTIVCMHLGSSSQILMTSIEAPIDVMISLQPINMVQAAADLVWSPDPAQVQGPALRALRGRHRLDPLRARAHRLRVPAPPQVDGPGLRRPAAEPGLQGPRHHLLHRRRLRRAEPPYMNVDNITWECDYPHSDSTWPQSPEAFMKYLDGVSDEDIDKMTHLNAMKHFRFDPFSVRPREKCTVGALRAEASDVDVSLVSRARGTRRRTMTAS